MKTLLFICLLVYSSFSLCTDVTFASSTQVLAHRASSGLWIQNTREGVSQTVRSTLEGELAQRISGVEVDIVLTQDLVPVLSHDPWVHERLCTLTSGEPVNYQLIKNVTFEDLQKNYRCGGLRDEDFPNASLLSESILGFDEFLSIMSRNPELIVYLDLKIQDGLTLGVDDYAHAVLSRLEAIGAHNSVYIEAPNRDALMALKNQSNWPFKAVLSYPAFYANSYVTLVGAIAKIKTFFLPSLPTKQAYAAGADAIASPDVVLNSRARKALKEANIDVISFTPNTADSLQEACQLGSRFTITDYPNLGPCQ